MEEGRIPPIEVVLVTGAGRGFGAALVDAYAARGVFVVALVRSAEAARFHEARHPELCRAIIGDVTRNEVIGTIEEALSALGRPLDLLVNNAGIVGEGSRLESIDPDELVALFQTHCVGALRVARAALPFLAQSASPLIVNISSRIGSLGRNAEGLFARRNYSYSYRIAKAAQNMLTLCMNEELNEQGIRALAVHPGQMDTVSLVRDAALTAPEAAAQFMQFIDIAKLTPRAQSTLSDTYGRTIPW